MHKTNKIYYREPSIQPIQTLGEIEEIVVKNEDLPDPILYPCGGGINSDDSLFSSPLYRLSQKQELQRL